MQGGLLGVPPCGETFAAEQLYFWTLCSVVFSTVPSDFSTVFSCLVSVDPSELVFTVLSSDTVRSQPTSTGVPKSDAINIRLIAVRFMVRSFQLCLPQPCCGQAKCLPPLDMNQPMLPANLCGSGGNGADA